MAETRSGTPKVTTGGRGMGVAAAWHTKRERVREGLRFGGTGQESRRDLRLLTEERRGTVRPAGRRHQGVSKGLNLGR